MLIYVHPGGNGFNVRAFSGKCWDVNSLYNEKNNLTSLRNSQTGRIIFVVLCPHCGKDPMRDIWQFYFAFFTQRTELYDTVINMFVLKKVLEDLQSLHIETGVILAER